MTSSNRVKYLMVNSSEVELKQRVEENSEKLELLDQGGITYLEFMLDDVFCMKNNVVAALHTFFENFAEEGILKTLGRNMSEISAQVKALSRRLAKANQLPLEAHMYILQGLTN